MASLKSISACRAKDFSCSAARRSMTSIAALFCNATESRFMGETFCSGNANASCSTVFMLFLLLFWCLALVLWLVKRPLEIVPAALFTHDRRARLVVEVHLAAVYASMFHTRHLHPPCDLFAHGTMTALGLLLQPIHVERGCCNLGCWSGILVRPEIVGIRTTRPVRRGSSVIDGHLLVRSEEHT